MLRKPGHSFDTLYDLRHTYGPVFTVYFGSQPSVFVVDLEPALEAFRDRKTDFAGRPWFETSEI